MLPQHKKTAANAPVDRTVSVPAQTTNVSQLLAVTPRIAAYQLQMQPLKNGALVPTKKTLIVKNAGASSSKHQPDNQPALIFNLQGIFYVQSNATIC